MDAETASRLLTLNRQFYQSFARAFAATRQRLQPGVSRALQAIPPEARVLDLGCGEGGVARRLVQQGLRGPYVGLDFSEQMLIEARRSVEQTPRSAKRGPETRGRLVFIRADLAAPNWDSALPFSPFDRILAFAVLHHLPGADLRRRALTTARRHLVASGRFILSVWQILNSARLRRRIQPWESIGLSAENVDPGDYLLDWRRNGYGLRYVHHFTPKELEELAAATGFRIRETFHSDGEGGNLGLYQIWEPVRQNEA